MIQPLDIMLQRVNSKIGRGGVIDPKKVTRTALENAASISMLLINTVR